ncbi:MAG: hypothetical protein R3C45_15885 [Phycisphaerales bacterium]
MPQRLAYYLALLTILLLAHTRWLRRGGHRGCRPPRWLSRQPGEDPDIIVVDDEATIAEIDAA